MNTGAAIIVFREMLEASLIISIVMAATRGVSKRGLWVSGGIILGAAGAAVLASFATAVAGAVEGFGQELFNAGILSLAVLMLASHNIWMASHGKALAGEMSAVGKQVSDGERPLYALMAVVGLAVLREGSEVVLFLGGMLSADQGYFGILSGGLVGLGAGALTGFLLYRGVLAIPMRYFFQATSWLILLLAAGLASGAVGLLEQIDWIPSLTPTLWDSSGLISESSFVGRILHTLVGYREQPSGMQVLVYVSTVLVIYSLQKWVEGRALKKSELALQAVNA